MRVKTQTPSIGRGYKSLFWPILLMGIGGIWLLSRRGFLQTENLTVLLRIWPVFLLAIGIDILSARQSPRNGALIGIGTIALVVILMIGGPSIGLSVDYTLKEANLVVPLDGAESLAATLELSNTNTAISLLDVDSANVFEADISYYGDLMFEPSGDAARVIKLDKSVHNRLFNWIPLFTQDIVSVDLVRFHSTVPTALDIVAGNGNLTGDLTKMNITALRLEVSNGNVDLTLPQSESPYDLSIAPGNGSLRLTIPDHTALNFNNLEASNGSITLNVGSDVNLDLALDMSNGTVTFNVEDNTGVRVDIVDKSNGTVSVPDGFIKVDGPPNDNREGTWESAHYSDTDSHINLSVDMSNGSLIIE